MLIKTIRKYKKIVFALRATFDPINDDLICGADKLLVISEKNIEVLEVNKDIKEIMDEWIAKN